MSAPRLSEFTKREIVKAYGRGDPVAEIAKRFGVDKSYPGLLAKRRAALQIRKQFIRMQELRWPEGRAA